MENVGNVDRIIRILIGVGLITWSILAVNFWWILGAALVATGVLKFCGLYRLLGINTYGKA